MDRIPIQIRPTMQGERNARAALEAFLAWPAAKVQRTAAADVLPVAAVALVQDRLRHHLGQREVAAALEATAHDVRGQTPLGQHAMAVLFVARSIVRPHLRVRFDGDSVTWALAAKP